MLHSSWNFPAKKCRFPSGYIRNSRHWSKDRLCFFVLHFSDKFLAFFVLFDGSFLFFLKVEKLLFIAQQKVILALTKAVPAGQTEGKVS